MLIPILTLVVALAISGVAAWYSIVGLMAIFSSAAFAIAVMGVVLEVGKLVTASWLYQNWNTSHRLLRGYLTKVISQLDSSVQTLIDAQRIRGKTGSISVRESQSVERSSLNGIISKASQQIISFRETRQGLSKEQLKYEAEVGPIRYIAEFVYNEKAGTLQLESAVRWVIIIIIFVFDPLAILLLIAANISLSKPKTMKMAVNVKELDEEWSEISVETEGPEPEFIIKNKDPENTVSFGILEEPPQPRKNKSVANTDYGSITDIRKKKKG